MTKYQILLAVHKLLEKRFEQDSDRSQGFTDYLRAVDPYLWTDGKTADPEYYGDFLEIMDELHEEEDCSPEKGRELAGAYLARLFAEGEDVGEVMDEVSRCSDEEWSQIVGELSKNKTVKYRCPCCGCFTMDEPEGSFGICPVCFWEDDPAQIRDPDLEGGANRVSLEQARANFAEFGACDENAVPFVRVPTAEEISGIVRQPDDSEEE